MALTKRQLFLRLLIFPGSLLLMIAGMPLYNYVTGVMAWKRTLAELEARGEPTEFSQLFPEPLDPDVEYFAEHPLLQAQMRFDEDEETGEIVYEDPELQEKLANVSLTPFLNDGGKLDGQPDLFSGKLTDFERVAESLGISKSQASAEVALDQWLSQYDDPIQELGSVLKCLY